MQNRNYNDRRLTDAINRIDQLAAPNTPSSLTFDRRQFVVKLGSALTARSGDTPGSGTGNAYAIGSGGDLAVTEPVTVYSASETEIDADEYVIAVQDRYGALWATSGAPGEASPDPVDPVDLVQFTLTANLAISGTAAATITTALSGTASGAITVTDISGYRSFTGAKGVAVKTGGVWNILHIDQPPILLECTADAPTPVSTEDPIVINGTLPVVLTAPDFNFLSGTDLTDKLDDLDNRYGWVVSDGDKFVVSYDYDADVFYVLFNNNRKMMFIGTATEFFDGTDTTDVSIESCRPLGREAGTALGTLLCRNPQKGSGIEGQAFIAAWDSSLREPTLINAHDTQYFLATRTATAYEAEIYELGDTSKVSSLRTVDYVSLPGGEDEEPTNGWEFVVRHQQGVYSIAGTELNECSTYGRVYLDGLALKQERCGESDVTIFTFEECP